MKSIKLITIFSLILFFTAGETVKEGFSNKKKNGSDEFLVEKKSPLVMPPDFNELPIPELNQNKKQVNKGNIKELITKKENKINKVDGADSRNLNIEKKILEKIKKN